MDTQAKLQVAGESQGDALPNRVAVSEKAFGGVVTRQTLPVEEALLCHIAAGEKIFM